MGLSTSVFAQAHYFCGKPKNLSCDYFLFLQKIKKYSVYGIFFTQALKIKRKNRKISITYKVYVTIFSWCYFTLHVDTHFFAQVRVYSCFMCVCLYLCPYFFYTKRSEFSPKKSFPLIQNIVCLFLVRLYSFWSGCIVGFFCLRPVVCDGCRVMIYK